MVCDPAWIEMAIADEEVAKSTSASSSRDDLMCVGEGYAFALAMMREISFIIVRHLHIQCWASNLENTGSAYVAATVPIVGTSDRLRATYKTQLMPGRDEAMEMQKVSCDCGNLISRDLDSDLAVRQYSQNALTYKPCPTLHTFLWTKATPQQRSCALRWKTRIRPTAPRENGA